VLTSADREHDTSHPAGPQDHVIRPRRAVHEVPLPQWPLHALDEQQPLTGEHQEILLDILPVVHPNRLTRPEHEQVDPDLGKVRRPLEGERVSTALAVTPSRLAGVHYEPALTAGHESGLGPPQQGFRNRHSVTTYSNEAQASSVKIAS
jgi:hypothetical protein